MAKCNYCGREMLTANGCLYKRVVIKGNRKKTFNRIKVGDPDDWYEKFVGTPEEKDIRCGDCGAKIQWYWVQNKVRESAATFAYVYYNGNAACYNVSLSMGVRPAFKIRSTVAKNQRITHSD